MTSAATPKSGVDRPKDALEQRHPQRRPRGRRRRGPPRHGARARALREAGVDGRGPGWAAARCRAAATRSCCACPTREIAAAAATVAGAAPLVGHTSGATPLSALAPARRRRLRPAPAPDLRGRRRRRRLRRRRLRGRRLHARGARLRRRSRARARHDAVRDRRRGPRRLPRRRLDGLQLPGHARRRRPSGSPPARGSSPTRPAQLLAPLVRRTVENWAALGPERALTGPVARGDEATVARPARGGRRGARPSCSPSSTRSSSDTRALASGARHEDRPHRRRAARGARPSAAPGAASGSCRPWAPSTRATSR